MSIGTRGYYEVKEHFLGYDYFYDDTFRIPERIIVV